MHTVALYLQLHDNIASYGFSQIIIANVVIGYAAQHTIMLLIKILESLILPLSDANQQFFFVHCCR